VATVKKEPVFVILDGQCAGPTVCPLSRVQPGTTVCIKRLSTGPEMTDRLRELGFCEEQRIKLVSSDSNYICQVCNARLGISRKLAEAILVETPAPRRGAPPLPRSEANDPEPVSR
jgi:Fe2+ transport system protein FeoA